MQTDSNTMPRRSPEAPSGQRLLRLFLLRHGQVPQVAPRRFLGQRDVPLDETGRLQAAAMGVALAEVRFDRAWCSDLRRAVETAGLVLDGRNLRPEPTPLLREISLGAWEGLSVEEVKARFPGEYERRGRDIAGYRTDGGESFRDVQTRAERFLHSLESRAATVPQNMLAVAHAGLIRTLLCAVSGKPLAELFDLGQEYCALNVLDRRDGSWILRAVNVETDGTADLLDALQSTPAAR